MIVRPLNEQNIIFGYYELPMPTATQQLSNAAAAGGRIAKQGLELRSKDEQRQCFEICLKCEYLSDKILKRCSRCGCCLDLKTRLKTENCPEGKW